jgi:uncharacterized delta-60 repeat protein
MYYGKAVSCLFVLIVIAFFVSCGGRQAAITNETSIQGAIAELDSMVTPKGADPAIFNRLKDALRTALLSRGDGKLVATPPTGAANAIPDLVITDIGGGIYNYTWHYYNVGDYNQDGTVGVPDITPLAMHYNETWNKTVPAEINTLHAVVDGSNSGTVEIADVTPIAMNFGVQVSAYRLEKCATENGTYTEVQIIPLSAGLDKDIARMRFSIDITPEAGMWYRLVPVDGEGTAGQGSNAMQPPSAATTWGHSWGNENSDHANAVATDVDGNTFVAGSYDVGSFTDAESILLKYSPDGTLLWAKTWGGAEDEYAYGVAVDADGNAYVTGEARSFASVFTVFILKYAPDGTLLWEKTWGDSNRCCGNAIALDGTGLLYVAGYELGLGGGASMLLLKYDTDGNFIDNKALSSANYYADAIAVNSTGDIYLAGRSKDTTSTQDDMLIVKYSALGMLLEWQKQWGNDPGTDTGQGICTDSSGNVYVVGRAYSGDMGQGGYEVALMKLDSNGAILWQETWGGAGHDEAFALTIDSSSNLYIAGHTYSFGPGGVDGMVAKFNSDGARLWAKAWGNSSQGDYFRAIALYPDNKLAIAGWDPMAIGSWSDASAGVTEAQTVPLVDASGTEVAPVGADAIPAGIEGTPSGVQDTGGGGDDILVLQVDPASW